MQVAVVTMRVVEGFADEVVHVVPVGNGLVAGAGRVLADTFDGGAGDRAAAVHLQPVLVGMPLVGRVKVAVVKVVGMIPVPDLPVSAPRTVLVVVTPMLATGHGFAPPIVSPEGLGVNPSHWI